MLSALLALVMTPDRRPAPLPPVPEPRQLAWQRLEFYAFAHFGPNTFTGVEWGEGREDPRVFNPTKFDARQWAETLRAAGMTGLIVTAKHHDGFCLWPSRLSTHTVAQTGWKEGRGDVLREISDACREAGLKFGVYLSPWDRNHPDYGTPKYNDVFVGMLEEVLTQYGPVFEVWFDGANGEGPNGKRQEYDWPRYIATVRRLQPDAVIFSDAGPDVRWIGNEQGFANPTNWSLLRRDEFFPGTPRYAELTSGHEDGTHWLPGEADVSIRPGWFYKASQDGQVKSPAQLVDIWYRSVGRNATLLLNVPPTPEGLIHPTDAEHLREMRRILDATFATDLARGASVLADGTFGPDWEAARLIDGDPETAWAASDDQTKATVTIELAQPVTFDRVDLREAIALGQRVRSFVVEARVDGEWRPLAEGTTIGARRVLRIPAVTADRVRLRILDSRAAPILTDVALFKAPAWAPPDPPLDETPPPLVHAEPDGTVKLDATAARLRGTLRYEADKNCIGFWTRIEDTVEWDFIPARVGRYRVSAVLACDPAFTGAEFNVILGTGAVGGTVPDTGGWGDFETLELGEIELVTLGATRVTLQPRTSPRGAVMNLRRVLLTPVRD